LIFLSCWLGLSQILSIISKEYEIQNDPEITFEADPGTFDASRLQYFRSLGINRLSLGIQSFNNHILEKCGRIHRLHDIDKAFNDLEKSSFSNFNIDLISSLPFLTLPVWEDTLRIAISTQAKHISVYDLQIEEKSAFGRWGYVSGSFPLPSEEISQQMYLTAVDILKNEGGFHHYEVSNYAKEENKYESRHNQKYWQMENVLGFGMGASSYLNGVRYTRPGKLKDYYNWITSIEKNEIKLEEVIGIQRKKTEEKQFLNFASAVISSHRSSPSPTEDVSIVGNMNIHKDNVYVKETQESSEGGPQFNHDLLEKVMLSLRTAKGLDLKLISTDYGNDIVDKILTSVQPFLENKSVVLIAVNEQTTSQIDSNSSSSQRFLRLHDPKGFILSNDIISSIFVSLMK
jgi:putative oxygen-independent coproporphyrinogen III oxidase